MSKSHFLTEELMKYRPTPQAENKDALFKRERKF